MWRLATPLFILLILAPAVAEEKTVELKTAPGVDKVTTQCGSCHSLDYIEMNSGFLSAAQWDAEITKMIRVMGAPINEADAKEIAEYLKKNYGS